MRSPCVTQPVRLTMPLTTLGDFAFALCMKPFLCATTFRGGDFAGRTRNLAFQCPFHPRKGSRAGTHDLVCSGRPGILPGGRRCSGGWVGGHPHPTAVPTALCVGRASPLALRSHSGPRNLVAHPFLTVPGVRQDSGSAWSRQWQYQARIVDGSFVGGGVSPLRRKAILGFSSAGVCAGGLFALPSQDAMDRTRRVKARGSQTRSMSSGVLRCPRHRETIAKPRLSHLNRSTPTVCSDASNYQTVHAAECSPSQYPTRSSGPGGPILTQVHEP